MYDESLTENRVSDVIPKNNTYRKKITVSKYPPAEISISKLLFFLDRCYFSIGDDAIASSENNT